MAHPDDHRPQDLVTIRPGTSTDIDEAIAVWIASNDARFGGPTTPPETEAMVRGWMAGPDAILLVAIDGPNGPIVGLTLAVDAREESGKGAAIPGSAHIALVFVAPGRWGQRIGARLLDAQLAGLVDRGYRHAQLWTHQTNDRARRLYSSRGFVPTGDSQVNAQGETIIRLERSLLGDGS
ncbi:MAG TPA: GNAT family N-acetyltransferase [Thermomicrobiales bacterium]|jgi:GNAT superfamily N-acetyltransferase|nr:GNAT family N-acetyltransferase [Thermomicrobiales bacterium]